MGFTDDTDTSLEKLRLCLSPLTFALKVPHWWTWQHWPELNSPRFCSVVLSPWLPDMALQEAVGSSCYSWEDPCLPGKEEEPEWAASDIKNSTCVGEGSSSSKEQYSQGKKEDDAAGRRETPGVCRSSPAVLLCPKGISDTACSEQHWMLPLLEKVPWLCVQHQSMALYNFFLSRSLKIHSLLFREMQCENLQNNHFLFR